MGKIRVGEWFWRFLSVVMLFAVGWTVWIIYQLNPPPLVMDAAFDAAAKAKGREVQDEKQVTQGLIAPAAKGPPINPEKLKFSDTIALPVPNANK